MSSISNELSKLADELNKLESQTSAANARLGGAKAKLDTTQAILTAEQAELRSAEKEVAEVSERKATLLKQVADLVSAESASLPQGGGIPRPELLSRPVNELELAVRTRNGLRNEGILYIGDLIQYTETKLLTRANMICKDTDEIKKVLASRGLGLGMKVENWQRPEASS